MVGGDGHASPLLQNNVIRLEARERILEILPQIAQVRGLLFRITVIFPQGSDDFAVGGLRAAVVDQQRYDLLGSCVFEGDRLSVHKQFEVSEGLGKNAALHLLSRGIAQLLQFRADGLLRRRGQNTAAGPQHDCLKSVRAVLREIDQVDERVQVLQILAQNPAVHFRQLRIHEGDVDFLLTGQRQRLRAALAAQHFDLGLQSPDHAGKLFQFLLVVYYGQDCHDSSFGPPEPPITRTC